MLFTLFPLLSLSRKLLLFVMLVDFVQYDFQMVIVVLLEHVCESKLYRTEEEVELLQSQIDEASSTSERVKLSKQLKKINEQLLELNKYEEVVHHWGDKMEPMDLDDGVKANYAKFQKLLAKIKKLASGAKAFRYTSYWCSHRSFIHHRLVLKKYIKSRI